MTFGRSSQTLACVAFSLPILASFALAACAGSRSDANPPAGVAVQSAPASPSAPATGQEPEPVPMAGVVVCGEQTCDLTTSYCVAGTGCQPKGPDFDPDRVGPSSMLCDDASDCAAGSVCCMQAGGGGEVFIQCSAKPCDLFELCVPGGACSAGRRCVKDGTHGTGASCQPADRGAPCGKERCGGDRPVCCWDDGAGKGTCVASDTDCEPDPNAGRRVFRCGSKADCAGYFCLGQMFPGTRCVGGGLFDYAMCETFADCPEREITTWEPYTHCRKDTHGFGWCATASTP